jgi:hypothetical protein
MKTIFGTNDADKHRFLICLLASMQISYYSGMIRKIQSKRETAVEIAIVLHPPQEVRKVWAQICSKYYFPCILYCKYVILKSYLRHPSCAHSGPTIQKWFPDTTQKKHTVGWDFCFQSAKILVPNFLHEEEEWTFKLKMVFWLAFIGIKKWPTAQGRKEMVTRKGIDTIVATSSHMHHVQYMSSMRSHNWCPSLCSGQTTS